MNVLNLGYDCNIADKMRLRAGNLLYQQTELLHPLEFKLLKGTSAVPQY